MFRGGPRSASAGGRRIHAVARGCSHRQQGKQEAPSTQQILALIRPPAKGLLELGIPYQCFSASAWLVSWRATVGVGLQFVRCNKWHRPSSVAGGEGVD
jgi:hypothetical protein